ncbi:MAG: SpoVG family protein [Oscillospiraceae bacterium]|jgi:stage V sporulation protein G|nr:SpoVG family protein [Oscillospiraceae bacterium]
MNSNLDIRVYPIDEPKGNTLAFASIAIGDLAAIRGVRIVDSTKGLFVSMPQSQSNDGRYHDVAFPLNGDLRKEINAAVIDEFERQSSLYPEQRGYDRPEAEAGGRDAAEVKLDVKVYPIEEPRGNTLAFASVGMDNTVAIRGIRVVNSDKGMFVSMPQSKDKDGVHHDMAFPLSGDLRKAVSNAVLADYRQQAAERRQGIGEQLADAGREAAQRNASAPDRPAAAKKAPGLGD